MYNYDEIQRQIHQNQVFSKVSKGLFVSVFNQGVRPKDRKIYGVKYVCCIQNSGVPSECMTVLLNGMLCLFVYVLFISKWRWKTK